MTTGNGHFCECGTECIDNCPVCGAPQCCPQCCKELTAELAARGIKAPGELADMIATGQAKG